MVRPSKMEEVLALSEKERVALRKECHERLAHAARNADPPNIEDMLVLDWLDIVFDGNMEAPRGEAEERTEDAVFAPDLPASQH
jgi:hypothetical protein